MASCGLLLFILTWVAEAAPSGPNAPSWGYELDLITRAGQLHWGKLPTFENCSGKQQSPIDIDLDYVQPYSPGAHNLEQPQHWFGQHRIHDHPLTQQFERNSEVVVDPDSHTIFLTVQNDDPHKPRNILSGAPLPPGAIYKMRALHFHAPAEHLVNHVQFPLEMHVVYDLIEPSPENPVTFEHAYPTYHDGKLSITYSRVHSTSPPVNATPAAVVGYLFQQHDGCTHSILSELRKLIEATPEYKTNKKLWSGSNRVPHAQRPKIVTKMDLSELLLYPYGYELEGDPCLLPDFNSTLPPMPEDARDPTAQARHHADHMPAHTAPPQTPRPIVHTEGVMTNYRNVHKLHHEDANPDDVATDDELDATVISIDPSALIQARAERQAAHDAHVRALHDSTEEFISKEYFDQFSEFAQRFELSFAHAPETTAELTSRHNLTVESSSDLPTPSSSCTGSCEARRSLEADIKSRVQEEALRIAALKKATKDMKKVNKIKLGNSTLSAHEPELRFGAAFPSFYSYRGSLTTPPCSQIITWLVGAAPIAASGEDIQFFWDLMYGNARLTQPVNGRPVSLINVTSASIERIPSFEARPPHVAHPDDETKQSSVATLPLVDIAEAVAAIEAQSLGDATASSTGSKDQPSSAPALHAGASQRANKVHVGYDVDSFTFPPQILDKKTFERQNLSRKPAPTLLQRIESWFASLAKISFYLFISVVLLRSTLYVLLPSVAYHALDLKIREIDPSRRELEGHRPSLAKTIFLLNFDIARLCTRLAMRRKLDDFPVSPAPPASDVPSSLPSPRSLLANDSAPRRRQAYN